MSEENVNQEENTELGLDGVDNTALPVVDELTALKQRAEKLNIQFHPNIGLEKLREKVNKVLEGDDSKPVVEVEAGLVNSADTDVKEGADYTVEELIAGYAESKTKGMTAAQLRNQAIKDANKLVRVRVTCMDPNKRDWTGEIFTVSNSVVGTFKKFVPYNLPEGWHIPQIIYQALKERKCQVFVNGTGPNGQRIKKAIEIAALAIEVLPPLTPDELKELGQRQLMATGAAN